MLHKQNAELAQQLATALTATFAHAQHELKALPLAVNDTTAGTKAGRDCVLQSIRTDLREAQKLAAPMLQHSRTMPSAAALLGPAERVVSAVDAVLDELEAAATARFNIPPVTLAPPAAAKSGSFDAPVALAAPSHATAARDAKYSPKTPARQRTLPPPSRPATGRHAVAAAEAAAAAPATPAGGEGEPVAPRRKSLEIPKTPCMEDFGLDAAELTGLLGMRGGGGLGGARPTQPQFGDSPGWGDDDSAGNLESAVERSMTKLGIETPREVADRYDERRNLALRGVMAHMPHAGGADSIDISSVAKGYSGEGRGVLRDVNSGRNAR